MNLNVSLGAFLQQHVDDLLRRAITKELPEFLFVIRNSVPAHYSDEILGFEPGESGFVEVRHARDEVFRSRANVREITAAPSGNTDLLTYGVVPFQNCNRPPAVSGFNRAHYS